MTPFLRPVLATAAVLLIPLMAMQFTSEVNWTLSDFVVMGIIVFIPSYLFEIALRSAWTTTYKMAAAIALAASFLLVWVNAAVGIIGDGPANLLYLTVIVMGVIGALMARAKPRGMSLTLFGMAVVQLAVTVIGLIVAYPDVSPGVIPVLGLGGFFAVLFAVSATLFQQAVEHRRM